MSGDTPIFLLDKMQNHRQHLFQHLCLINPHSHQVELRLCFIQRGAQLISGRISANNIRVYNTQINVHRHMLHCIN